MNLPEAEPDLLSLFASPVHQAGFRYVVGGSVGAMHYSEPRFTLDVDIPILLRREDAGKLRASFPEPDFYCPPEDVIAIESQRECHGHFNVIHIPSGLKADFYPSANDELFEWAWENRRVEDTPSGPICIAPPEYVILWKLEYYRLGHSEKHLRDIRKVLTLQGDRINMGWLEKTLERRGLGQMLRLLAES